jgi:hypothetical protein
VSGNIWVLNASTKPCLNRADIRTTDFRDGKRGDEEVTLVAWTAISAAARLTH